jgi:hypothetical protein
VILTQHRLNEVGFAGMPRVVKRSASHAFKSGSSQRSQSRSNSPLPAFIPPRLSLKRMIAILGVQPMIQTIRAA